MKKLFCILFSLLIIIASFSACKSENEQSDKLSIVTTVFPQYDFCRQLVGDKAEVTMLLSPGEEVHSFEPTPQDIIKIQKSDLFIYVGGESDEWIDDILSSLDTSKMQIIDMMSCVDTLEEEIQPGMQTEEADHNTENSDEKEYDEHIWTSIKNAVKITKKILNSLCEIDRENADFYSKNADEYISKLNKLDAEYSETIKNAKRRTLVFGDRFPFRYLTEEYGLDYYAAFPGCSAQTEPSAATISFLIDKVKKENIPVVFYIEFSNQKMADTICEATNAKKLLLHSCHNVSKDDFNEGVTYISLMEKNLSAIKEAIS